MKSYQLFFCITFFFLRFIIRTTNGQSSSFNPIAGYTPITDVVEQTLIDTDQKSYSTQLALMNENGFQSARQIYEQESQIDDGRRSLKSFSTETDVEMRNPMDEEFFPFFQNFLDYFGQTTFADDVIRAAIDGTVTTSGLSGNFDFTQYGYEGRAIIAEKSTVFLSLLPYIVRNLETAILNCPDDGMEAVAYIDEAVAYYTGSLEGIDGSGNGVLLYNEADERCKDLKTCGNDANLDTGTSQVNLLIMTEFEKIRDNIVNQLCNDASINRDEIIRLLQIPFIQGTLSFAYKTSSNEISTTEKDIAYGTIVAATILPMINTCNFDDGKIIFDNTKPSSGDEMNFIAVRDAIEKNYSCLNISCEEIGGIWNPIRQRYYDDAQLCGQPSNAPTAPTVTPPPISTSSPTIKPTPSPTIFIMTDAPISSAPVSAPVSLQPTTNAPISIPTTRSPISLEIPTNAPVPAPTSQKSDASSISFKFYSKIFVISTVAAGVVHIMLFF